MDCVLCKYYVHMYISDSIITTNIKDEQVRLHAILI